MQNLQGELKQRPSTSVAGFSSQRISKTFQVGIYVGTG